MQQAKKGKESLVGFSRLLSRLIKTGLKSIVIISFVLKGMLALTTAVEKRLGSDASEEGIGEEDDEQEHTDSKE